MTGRGDGLPFEAFLQGGFHDEGKSRRGRVQGALLSAARKVRGVRRARSTLPAALPLPVDIPGRRQTVAVEVLLRFRLERCPGPLALGDLVYSTTLLPGEKVRLFSSDRHSRFSFDTESKLTYRHETTSEETLFAAGMASAMSDLSVVERAGSSSSSS